MAVKRTPEVLTFGWHHDLPPVRVTHLVTCLDWRHHQHMLDHSLIMLNCNLHIRAVHFYV